MKRNFDEENNTPKPLRVIWLIIKIVLSLGLIVMLGWLTLRSCYQEGTSKMKKYMWTESAVEQHENGELTVLRMTEYNDPELSRLFYIGRIYYTQEISQFQFMLRYNVKSTEYTDLLGDTKKIAESSDDAGFVFELTDKNGNHYTSYSFITDKAMMYRYVRLAFDNVDISLAEELVVNIYLRREDGTKSHIGSCIVWQKDAPSRQYKFSQGENKSVKVNPDIVAFSWKETGQ